MLGFGMLTYVLVHLGIVVRRRGRRNCFLNLEFPYNVERDEVIIIRRVVPLERACERSAASAVRSRARVHELPRDAGCYLAIDLILDAGAIPQLAIDRQA